MVASQVSVRDPKTHLSEWLARAQSGEVVEVTSYRKPIARITAVKPADSGIIIPLQKAIDAGLISWNGEKPNQIRCGRSAPLLMQMAVDIKFCCHSKSTSRDKTKPRPLPPMRPGHGAEDLGLYMRRRKRWQELRQMYETAGEKLVLYSARHGYAHRAHLICELPPKVAAAAMGHSLETHLAAYSKWCGDDVIDTAFKQAASRLGR